MIKSYITPFEANIRNTRINGTTQCSNKKVIYFKKGIHNIEYYNPNHRNLESYIHNI